MNNLSIRKNNELSKKKKKGFTLVELIIVIAIIAILAAMAIPKLSSMRADAKVSNDVAAAKNIATIVSTLIANGDSAITKDGSAIDVSATAAIKDKLDGKAATGIAEALKDEPFEVTVSAKEEIAVYVGDKANVLYPDDSNGTGKGKYIAAVKAQK